MGVLIAVLSASLLQAAPASAVIGRCDWDQNPGWVARENKQLGSRNWNDDIPLRLSADFSRRKDDARIEGWFGTTSAVCGQVVAMHLVGGSAAKVSIYRMGYYNGARARLIKEIDVKTSLWKYKVATDTPPGQYLFRLDARGKRPSFVPLVIRSEKPKSAVTFISSVLTWQSYNQWGGSSLYKGPDAKRETKAKVVSFNRPYDGDGSGQFRYMEFPAIYIAERNGIDINYITDIDLDSDPTILRSTRAIVFGGHSEYWTARMRGAIDTVVSRGVSLVVLGGNTAYNQITLGDKSRTMSNIIKFRNIRKPESLLLGSQYFALGVHEDYKVTSSLWPFNVLKKGSVIKGIAGYEVDSSKGVRGPAVEVLASGISGAQATFYKNASGARVLNMGTNGWVCAIENVCPWGHEFSSYTRSQVRRVTQEIFAGLVER